MFGFVRGEENRPLFNWGIIFSVAVFLAAVLFWSDAQAAAKRGSLQKSFASPEEAVKALADAIGANDAKELSALLGSAGKPLIHSGDDVADAAGRARFKELYADKNQVKLEGDAKAILLLGKDDWPLPIPIVKGGGVWRFDTKAGLEEMLNRRIGRNELTTMQVCLAYVDAQNEYASKDRDGDGLLEYAQKFISSPGQKDGLYWETKEGEEPSPLGPFAAKAQKEGYTRKKGGDQPSPFHGYFFKILKAQGRDAKGGAYSYMTKNKMITGFALVAYPASYGSSGIMTFIVNQDGVVYEKDLGRKTEMAAQAMKSFNPDKTWSKAEPKPVEEPASDEGA